MLFRELLIEELNAKLTDFARFTASQADELESYQALIEELSTKTSEGVAKRVGTKDVGAVPSTELDRLKAIKQSFDLQWQNHERARAWAGEILKNRTTFAADGSQLTFEREISMRVAAVQVGTFENDHAEAGSYRKQAKFEIVTPQDVADFADEFEEPFRTSTIVGLRRFQAETRAIEEFLSSKTGWRERGEPVPLAFFDGTLLVSFSLPTSRIQHEYIKAARQIAMLSKKSEVPVVGYVAQSEARDLIGLLNELAQGQFFLHQESKMLSDAHILSEKTLQKWGDRSIFFACRRKGLSDYFVDENADPLVGFVYLQATSDALPARLDIPVWVYEAGLLEEVTNVVRAECIVGLGYPYALETADATAVITMADREVFLRALQDFAVRANLNFRVSNKKMSKARRR